MTLHDTHTHTRTHARTHARTHWLAPGPSQALGQALGASPGTAPFPKTCPRLLGQALGAGPLGQAPLGQALAAGPLGQVLVANGLSSGTCPRSSPRPWRKPCGINNGRSERNQHQYGSSDQNSASLESLNASRHIMSAHTGSNGHHSSNHQQ